MNALSAEHIDDVGNDSDLWSFSAGDLLASRDTLAKQRTDAEAAGRNLSVPRVKAPEERSYWVEVMLVGFAVENLLKAFWVRKGNRMYVNGRLQKLKGTRSHDLVQIAGSVGFAILDAERDVLATLSEIMIGIGRYPFTPRPDLQSQLEGWSNVHDDVVRTMIHRLREEIHNARPV